MTRLYRLTDPTNYLTHDELHVDEAVWLTPDDVARGKDTVVEAALRWILNEPMPASARDMVVVPALPESVKEARIVFSALPVDLAKDLEPQFAQNRFIVCSNASSYRRAEDVPLLLPEVNADHIALIKQQRAQRGWSGAILTNPNCTSTGLTVALKALQDSFGLKRAFVVSLQALSGAGYPGVSSLDIMDNVIPNIGGEEDKVEWEPRKMLGTLKNTAVTFADVRLSVHTNRVAVVDGHTVCVSVELNDSVAVHFKAGRCSLLEWQRSP